MKTLYLQCNMGAAGDMLTAALLELHPNPAAFVEKLNGLGLPGIHFEAKPAVKCGITGTHMEVLVHGQEEHSHDHHSGHGHEHHHEHDHGHEHTHHHEHDHDHEHEHHHEHHHTSMEDIRHILGHLNVPAAVRENAEKVYTRIAQAEGHVHGKEIEQIHFHEVGSLDAVADVVAVCWLMEELKPQQIIVSPIATGSGQVRCAHGILPVPAPATAYILRGAPSYSGEFSGELCTPTGAALLQTFATSFGSQPIMAVEAIGYGMGNKDFPAANCVRAILGRTQEQSMDEVLELACNLDDCTAEQIGFAVEALMAAGALDVFTTAIGMKKGRPATMLTVLCRADRREAMLALLFRHTTTLGVRETPCRRYTLTRREEVVETADGPVRVKRAEGYGVARRKAEYEDLAAIARRTGKSLTEIAKEVEQ